MGINSRLDELQAAFLRFKLRALDAMNQKKKELAEIYLSGIRNECIILPVVTDENKDVWHIFNIRCSQRDLLKNYLLKNGIGTEVHYPVPPHRQVAYAKFFEGKYFPISDEMHETTLSLPISSFHTRDDVRHVVEALNRFEGN